MVEHGDPHQLPRPHQASRQRHVVVAGRRIAGRMVVKQDDRRRPAPAASRNTSRGWTMLASSVPTDSRSIAARDASCRAGRRRSARPGGCRTAAPAAPRHRERSTICGRSRAAAHERAPARFDCGDQLRGARARRCPARWRRSSESTLARAREGRRPTRARRWRVRARRRAARRARGRSRAARCRRAPPAPTRSSFSRGRSCGATDFIVHHTCYTSRAMRRLSVIALLLLLRGRLLRTPAKRNRSGAGRDRHRARRRRRQVRAGRYTAATSALQKAHDAVDQRDFRQALGYALDARERAQGSRSSGRRRQGAARACAAEAQDCRHRRPRPAARGAAESGRRGPRPRARAARQPRRRSPMAEARLQKARTAFGGRRLPAGQRTCCTGIPEKLDAATRRDRRRSTTRTHRQEVAGRFRAASGRRRSLPPNRSDRARRRATPRAGCRPETSTWTSRRRAAVRDRRDGRRAGAGPGRLVGPTPRSQIRMRTRPGPSTVASSTFEPSGNAGWTASRAASACRRASLTSPSTTH